MNSIISDLEHLIEGEVSGTEEDLAAVSQDFGIIQKTASGCCSSLIPPTLLKRSSMPIKLTISSRAAGHSLGQSLNQGGILLRSLNQIHEFPLIVCGSKLMLVLLGRS